MAVFSLAAWMLFPGILTDRDAFASMVDDPEPCFLPPTLTEDGSTADKPGPDALDRAYSCFEPRLLSGYAQSKHVMAQIFGDWERATEYPFIHDVVGDRYLVVYGNERAVGDEKTLWLDRDMPVGAIVVAAGFTVGESGELIAAPAMIYEKMVNGFAFGRGNWRQTLIAPDGEILGVSNGPGAENLTACVDCAARSADRLYLALTNNGIMPPNAPEPSAPIVENELGGPGGGETLDPGAILDPLSSGTSAQDSGIPPAESFDPNPSLDPSTPLDPLAPLDPMAPLDPLAPQDSSESLDPLAPLDPGTSSSDGLSDQSPQLSEDTAALDPLPPLKTPQPDPETELRQTDEESNDDIGTSSADNNDNDIEDVAALDGGILPGLSLELTDAPDPLLSVPAVEISDPPPFLELPSDTL